MPSRCLGTQQRHITECHVAGLAHSCPAAKPSCSCTHQQLAWRINSSQAYLVLDQQLLQSFPQVRRHGLVALAGGVVGGVDVDGAVAAHNQPRRLAAVHRLQVLLNEPADPKREYMSILVTNMILSGACRSKLQEQLC